MVTHRHPPLAPQALATPERPRITARQFSSPRHKADPFPLYERLRRAGPVHPLSMGKGKPAWIVVRHEEARAALKDRGLVKDPARVREGRSSLQSRFCPSFLRPLLRNMLDTDEPDHGRLRELVGMAFTQAAVSGLRPRIESLAQDLLDRVASRPGRAFDLVRDFALPLPARVIVELIGVPQEDRHRITRWSQAMVGASFSLRSALLGLPACLAFLRYIRELVRRRRRAPEEGLLDGLILAEASGDSLDEDEVVAMVFLLLVAGHETTAGLLANGALALLEHPEQLRVVRSDRSSIPRTTEELLRFAGPLEFATERYAARPLEIAGQAIPAGSLVLVAVASANRDERVFPDPETLDLKRTDNPHLAFGCGPHYCLGASLARLETEIALNALLDAGDLVLREASTRRRWCRGLVIRRLQTLPVRLA